MAEDDIYYALLYQLYPTVTSFSVLAGGGAESSATRPGGGSVSVSAAGPLLAPAALVARNAGAAEIVVTSSGSVAAGPGASVSCT